MSDRLRFAEAVCVGHPDRLADTIAERIVTLATARDPEALVGVEVALHRNVVFIDGRVAAGRGSEAAVDEAEIAALARQVFVDAGYGRTPSGVFTPHPASLEVRTDLCLGPLPEDERAIRDVSDDQSICVGHAVWGPRAGHRPLEQALASDFAAALERLRVDRPDLGLGPDGKTLVTVRARALLGVSLSVQHAPGIDWIALTRETRAACEAVAAEYVAERELEPLRPETDWLGNGAGAFEVGGPEGDNGLSGKKLVAQAYGSAVPIGGGATCGKDPRKVDPRGQALARKLALDAVCKGKAREATVWLAYRPGDLTPHWIEVVTEPDDADTAAARSSIVPQTAVASRSFARSSASRARWICSTSCVSKKGSPHCLHTHALIASQCTWYPWRSTLKGAVPRSICPLQCRHSISRSSDGSPGSIGWAPEGTQ